MLYPALLFLHSVFRWIVLASLLLAVYRSYCGYRSGRVFRTADDRVRHWTATIAHIQLMIGFTLYLKSPVVKYFFGHFRESIRGMDSAFFGLVHISLMMAAITVVTIGSARAKRSATDKRKFGTVLAWFSAALLIIFLAIPWPFSPFAARPYIRHF